MAPRRGRHGMTFIELIVSSSVAAVIGGVVLLLTNSVRNVYQAHATLAELSGYLDVATYQLRKDIWGATANPTAPPGTGVCGAKWLDLGNVDYCFNTDQLTNVKLQRWVNNTFDRNIAQFVVPGTCDPNLSTCLDTSVAVDATKPALVIFRLTVRKAVNGRTYTRSVRASYCRQAS